MNRENPIPTHRSFEPWEMGVGYVTLKVLITGPERQLSD